MIDSLSYLLICPSVREFEVLSPTKRIGHVLVVLCVALNAVVAQKQSGNTSNIPDEKAEFAYILTIEKVNKLGEVGKALAEWTDKNGKISAEMLENKAFTEGALTERVRIVEKDYPEFAAVIHKHGMSTREYLLGTRVLVHVMLVLDAKQLGEHKAYDKNVNPANLAFVEQHWEEIGQNIPLRIKM